MVTVDPGAEARTRVWEDLQEDLQEDLFVGLKKVLDNRPVPQELWSGRTAVPL